MAKHPMAEKPMNPESQMGISHSSLRRTRLKELRRRKVLAGAILLQLLELLNSFSLALRRFDTDFLVQMFGSDPLIQAVLGIHRLKLGHFDPFFSRLFLVSQGLKGLGIFGVMNDSVWVEFDRFLEVGNRCLRGRRRELAVYELGDALQYRI